MRRTRADGALLAILVLSAGCLGFTAGPTEPTPTPPTGEVVFPDGPNEPPDRPDELTESSVREFVLSYEYRYVYNVLHDGGDGAISLDCGIDRATEQPWGYEVVVTCTGSSDSRDDWETQSYRYQVSNAGVNRTRVGGSRSKS